MIFDRASYGAQKLARTVDPIDERDVIRSMDSVGRSQDMTVVSESGLYALVLLTR